MTAIKIWSCRLWLVVFLIGTRIDADDAVTKKEHSPNDSHVSDRLASEGSGKFLRVRRTRSGDPIALETAIARYSSSKGESPTITVDLIGAVHVADESYYAKLNEILPTYEVLLFELVAPEGTQIPAPGEARHTSAVSGIQRALKSMLDLEFQLDQIDYTHDHFVHADMSPEEFAESMRQRNESFLKMYFRLLGHGLAVQSKDPLKVGDMAMFMALFSKDRTLQLKRLMAEQLEDLNGAIAAFGGPDGSTIITQRNKRAFEVLREEIDAGKKRIGVFYGAGHLPDMEKRILDDFDLKPTSVRWLPAWSLQPRDKPED